jgi:hypothetical protein
MGSVHHLLLGSLIFFVVALVAGLALAAWRGWVAWRTLRRFQRMTGPSMLEVERRVSQLELRAAGITAATERIDTARAQLEESLAAAKVIGGGAREIWATFRLVRGLVPTK